MEENEMNQDKIFEKTKKATEKGNQITKKMIDKSKELSSPSDKADKIGTTIGSIAGVGLLLGGTLQLIMGKSTWAIGTISLGAISLISNRIHYQNKRKKKSEL